MRHRALCPTLSGGDSDCLPCVFRRASCSCLAQRLLSGCTRSGTSDSNVGYRDCQAVGDHDRISETRSGMQSGIRIVDAAPSRKHRSSGSTLSCTRDPAGWIRLARRSKSAHRADPRSRTINDGRPPSYRRESIASSPGTLLGRRISRVESESRVPGRGPGHCGFVRCHMKRQIDACTRYRQQILTHFITGELWDSNAQSHYDDCVDCICAVTHALNEAGRPEEDLTPDDERALAAAFRAAGIAVPAAVELRISSHGD